MFEMPRLFPLKCDFLHYDAIYDLCFKNDRTNTFHLAHGTVPSLDTTMGKWVSGSVKKYDPNHQSRQESQVNVPKYFYMAFCCSKGDIEFDAVFEDRVNARRIRRSEKRQTTQFAVFEHLDPRIPGSRDHNEGDRITVKDLDKFFADLESFWTDNGNDIKNFAKKPGQLPWV